MIKHAEDVDDVKPPTAFTISLMRLAQHFNLQFLLAAVDTEAGLNIWSLVGIIKEHF